MGLIEINCATMPDMNICHHWDPPIPAMLESLQSTAHRFEKPPRDPHQSLNQVYTASSLAEQTTPVALKLLDSAQALPSCGD